MNEGSVPNYEIGQNTTAKFQTNFLQTKLIDEFNFSKISPFALL